MKMQSKATTAGYGSTGYKDIESGVEDDELNSIDNFDYTDKSIRRSFQQKIYSLLMIQLLITTSIIGFFVFNTNVKSLVLQRPEFFWISFIFVLATLIMLTCSETLRRKHPINLIILGIFTIAESILLGAISINYDTDIILMVIGVTGLVCVTLMLYAKQTKYDFTVLGGVLLTCLLVFVLFGLIMIFIPSRIFQCIYSAIGVLLFSFYLIMDTQLITSGKHRYSLSPEEYILAVLTLYVDIINLYVYLLSIFGMCKN